MAESKTLCSERTRCSVALREIGGIIASPRITDWCSQRSSCPISAKRRSLGWIMRTLDWPCHAAEEKSRPGWRPRTTVLSSSAMPRALTRFVVAIPAWPSICKSHRAKRA